MIVKTEKRGEVNTKLLILVTSQCKTGGKKNREKQKDCSKMEKY